METDENEQYVAYSLPNVHDSIVSHEEICDPVDECVLQENLTEVSVGNAVTNDIVESQNTVKILTEQSDDEENQKMYPIYIKQEQQQQYTSGDDESMAVEALRQLGGMYPCFEDKKLTCPSCKDLFTQDEISKHQSICAAKLFCTICGEKFERKIDLNNHMVCHQVDRPHACRTCGNLFRSKSSLQAHMMQVHQIERPHKCTICGSEFQRPSSLSNHMKIHTYIAGRAMMSSQGNNIVQSVETFRKWSENASESQNTSQIPSTSSTQSIQNYEVCQVQWPTSSYSFNSEQSPITTISNSEKIETLPEFTVISNGEVTQFSEYTEQNAISNSVNGQNINNQQYSLPLNSFNNTDGIVKIETISYNETNQQNYNETETNDSKQYTCRHCGINFSRATALASHEKIHSPSKNWNMPIECEYCDKQFQDGNHLATHQTNCAKKIMQNNLAQGKSNSKWGKHACSECGKKFATKQKMFRHQWIHRKKTHSCEVCGSQFEKQNELDEHRLSAHPGDSPFTCTECGKSFVSRQGLWEHGRTHAGSPAHFQCDTCSKTFSSRQGYLIHNRTHTGERPYGCKFCWKAFRDGGTLRKHERIHTGERPHVCPLCTRAFNQKVVLREHVRWVHVAEKNEPTSNPPYPCPVCGALNQDRDELCAHIVKHSDQMIAAAKAKTNNVSLKSKTTKKKSSKLVPCDDMNPRLKPTALQHLISKTEQNEALLSITDQSDKSENMHVVNDRQNNAFVVVTTTEKRNEGFITISELKHSNIRFIVEGKEDENVHVIQVDQNHRDHLISDNTAAHIIAEDNTVLDGVITSSDMTTMHLIQSTKQNNTLNIISRQNESLPVLALPNPQSHDDYASQIVQVSSADISMVTQENLKEEEKSHVQNGQDPLMQEGASHVIQVVQYHQHVESDDGNDFICGICDEMFENKNTLKEHIKVHI